MFKDAVIFCAKLIPLCVGNSNTLVNLLVLYGNQLLFTHLPKPSKRRLHPSEHHWVLLLNRESKSIGKKKNIELGSVILQRRTIKERRDDICTTSSANRELF